MCTSASGALAGPSFLVPRSTPPFWPETSPTLLWTGKVGDASAFRVWGSRAFVRDLSADKLSPRAAPCVFLGFPPDAPGWQFYHPTSRRVLSSQDVTFDESVPYHRLFPYRTAPLPPPPLFLAPDPPPVDPLPPQGPAPSGVTQVDAVERVVAAVYSGAARGAEPAGAGSGGAEPEGAELGGAESRGAESGGAESGGAEPGGAEFGGAGFTRVASRSTSSRRELVSPQELREWFARRWSRAAGAGGTTVAAGSGGTRTCGAGAAGAGGVAEAAGVGPAGATGGTGAAGPAGTGATGATVAGAAGGVGAGGSASAGTSEGAGAGAVGARGAADAGAAAGSTGAVPALSGDATRSRPYFVPLLEQVLCLPPSPGLAPPLECPQPVQSPSQLHPASPLPAPSPYTGPTGGLAERLEPTSRPASPVRAARTNRRAPRPRPPAVPGTHQMALRPSTAPLLSSDPASDSLRAASPTVTRLLATVATDPSFESTVALALVAELVDFAAHCRLDYAASLVAESASVCPPSVGDPDAPDIPTLRSYAEAIEGPYSSQWQSAMDAEMASWKSTGTYVDEVPPPGANIVSGMWILRVKRPPGSPPVFKARYVARGFSQRQGVNYFQTFSPTPKMTTLRVLLYVAAQRDYELHSLDFSTAFLQGSLHEKIWLHWHDTLRTTLAALGFAPSTADPSLFLRTNTSLPPFYILVYVDDLVFATADTAGLAHVKSELQKRHTCTDLVLHSFTPVIALRYFLARELQQRGQLRLAYMASQANTADIFTKALPPGDHQRICTMLGAAPGAASGGAASKGAEPGVAGSEGAGSWGAEPGGEEPGGAEPEGVEPGGAESEGAESGGAEPRGAALSGGPAGASPRMSPQQLREWLFRRARLRSGAPGAGAAGIGGVGGAGGGDPTEPRAAAAEGSCAGGAGAGGAGVGGTSAGGAGAAGAGAVDTGAGGAGGTMRQQTYFIPLLQQSGGLTECREPASRPVSPVRIARRVPRLRPPPVPGTHVMALRPSSIPLRVPLPAPPESSLPAAPNLESDSARAASPTVSWLLATAVTDPSFESVAASALVPEMLDFAAACRLNYATALVVESSQEHGAPSYCTRSFSEFGFQFSSPQPTPLSTGHSLFAPPSDESVESSGRYPELVGCLMVMRYLCSTSGMGLVVGGRGPVVLTGHADASWADDSATQRSSQGYTFSLGAMAAQELQWLTYLLSYLGEQPRLPPVMYVDNKAMIALCQEHRLEHKTKHITLRYFLARVLQQCGQLRLGYVATRANTADVFTKALPPGDHQRFSTVLGLVPTLPHLLTA
ncbi:unnamed protein product [Closterium sp. NIES-54]